MKIFTEGKRINILKAKHHLLLEKLESSGIIINSKFKPKIGHINVDGFSIRTILKPSNEIVKQHLINLGLNFDEQKNDFVLQNLTLLDEDEDKNINELFLKFDEYEAKKEISTKDKEEIRLFLDYQIHKIKFNMLKLKSINKGKLDELRDLRKQILMPHNLSLDILKSKLCLYI